VRDDDAVPENITVWAVELGRGLDLRERKGVLSLDGQSLRFAPWKEEQPEVVLPLHQIASVRRLRGSPVLMVARRAEEGLRRTAYYFVQPPPLPSAQRDIPERPSINVFRNPKRKARRQNVGYLGLMNKAVKAELIEWDRAVRAAVAAAKRT
jgi:hypothetical protein